MSQNAKAFKAGVWYTIGNFIVKASSFITMPIFTRLLSSNDIGDFANYSSWISILMIITTIDLYCSINLARFDYCNEIDDYIASILVEGSIITSLCFGLLFIFQTYFLNLFSLSSFELLLIFIYCLFYPASQMYQLKCRIEYKYKETVIISLISVLSSTLLSLVLVLTLSNKYFGRYFGYTVPIITINVVLYISILLKARKIRPRKYWKYAFFIAFPMIWHTLAGNLLTSSDRVMIKRYCGSNEAAMYTIPYSCASIVQVLWISMNSAWTPWAFEKMNQNDYKSINKAMKPYSIFFGVIVFLFLLISPEVLLIIGGKTYLPALKVIPPIMISYVFNFSYSFYSNIELYEKKQVNIAVCTVLAAIINIFLNIILIPKYGYVIAAYTTLIGYISLVLMHYFSCKIIHKDKLVDNRFVLVFLLISLFSIPIIELIYKYNLLRYIFIVTIIIVGIIITIFLRKELIYTVRYQSLDKLLQKIKSVKENRNEENRN